MVKISLKYIPDFVCIVPEKKQEITTEGGLNLKKKEKSIKQILKKLKKKKYAQVCLLSLAFRILKLQKI